MHRTAASRSSVRFLILFVLSVLAGCHGTPTPLPVFTIQKPSAKSATSARACAFRVLLTTDPRTAPSDFYPGRRATKNS